MSDENPLVQPVPIIPRVGRTNKEDPNAEDAVVVRLDSPTGSFICFLPAEEAINFGNVVIQQAQNIMQGKPPLLTPRLIVPPPNGSPL